MAGASRIAGITVEFGGDTRKLTDALKGVNRSIEQTQSTLKDVNKLLKLDPGNTDLLKQKQTALKAAISETKEKLDALQRASKDSDLGKDQHDAIQREIEETKQKLDALKKAYSDFGSVAKQKLQAVGRELKEIGGKISSAGRSVSEFGGNLSARVTLPLVAVGTAGAAAFANVDKTMQLTNETMGNTREEADLLNRAMKDAAANSTFGMNDAATASLNFARAGLKAQEAADALAPAMNLAAGEGGELDTVSADLVATINGFHGAFSETAHYADVFAAACNNSALDVNSLSGAMSVAAPIFSAAGYRVEDAALYMGVMANNGIEANKAANSLKTGIARLVKPTEEGAAMMERLGISVTNSDGSMKDSVRIQKELHAAFSDLSESEQIAAASAIFGKNQMAPWLALINTAPEDVDALSNSLTNCKGTTDEMATAMMSGFGGSLEKLKSGIDVLVTSVGEALAPTIQKAVDFIQGLVDKFNALSPAQQEQIAKIGLIVAAVGPLIVLIGKVISGVGSVISIGGSLASALGALCSPIGLVVAAIGGAIAAGVALYKNWDEIKAWAGEKWSAIRDSVSGAVATAKEKISQAWDAVKAKTSEAWESVKEKLSSAWDAIASTLSGAADTISGWFSGVGVKVAAAVGDITSWASDAWATISGAFSDVFSFFSGVASNIWSGITTGVSAFAGAIGAWFTTNILDPIKSVFSLENFGTFLTDFAANLWNGLTGALSSGVEAAKEKVKGFFSNVWDGVLSFFGIASPSKLAAEAAGDVMEGFGQGAEGREASIGGRLKSVFSGIWDAAKGAWDKVSGWLGRLFGWGAEDESEKDSATAQVGSAAQEVADAINLADASGAISEPIKTGSERAEEALSDLAETSKEVGKGIREDWDGVKVAVSGSNTGMDSAVKSSWTSIRNTTNSTLTAISTTATSMWESIKATASQAMDTIKSTSSDAWNNIKSTAANAWNSVKSSIANAMSEANSVVRDGVRALQDRLDFDWRLPPIKLPHFKINGSFSLDPPSAPTFSVNWYKKAMDSAMVLDSATIFGAAGGKFLGGGEAGREVVSGEAHLLSLIDQSVNSAVGARVDSVVRLLEQYLPGCAQTKVAVPVNSLDRALAANTARRNGAW